MMADCHHCDLEHILKFYMRPTLGNYFEVGVGYEIYFFNDFQSAFLLASVLVPPSNI